MNDSAESLIDADARIQERAEQLQQERARRHQPSDADAALLETLESLRLARTDLDRQLATTVHELRRTQIRGAIAELDRRIAEASARLNG
jgi:hypothetical protein